MANNTNTSWERIQQGVSDTERLIGQKEYNASMIKARQTLEFMVKLLSERAGLDDGCDLKTQIDLLYQNSWISKSACEHYHKIRIIGNAAVHDGDSNAYSANQAYHMLSQEVYAFTDSKNAGRTTGRSFQPSKAAPASGRYSSGSSQNNPAARYGSGQSSSTGRYGSSPSQSSSTGRYGSSPSQSPSAGRYGSGSSQNSPASRYGSASSQGGAQILSGASSTQAGRPASSRSTQPARSSQKARSSQNNRRSSSPSRRRTPQKRQTITLYDLLKLLVPVLCIILLFFVIRLFKPGEDTKDTTAATTPSAEYMTEPPSADAVPDTTAADNAAPVYKTTDTLNVRSQPNTDGERIGQLAAGTTVEYIRAHDSEWAVILYNGQEAYVASQYLSAE